MNVGASSPEDYGLYFQWGDTLGYTADQVGYGEGQKAFTWSDYKWGVYDSSDSTNKGMTKYNKTDGKITLDPEDDAAHVNMGGDWRTPTKEECQELIDNTTNEWISDYNGTGVSGRLFTSKINENSIFVPAAGRALSGYVYSVGSGGDLWSSSLREGNTVNAWYLFFNSGNAIVDSYSRYYGISVRAVLAQ